MLKKRIQGLLIKHEGLQTKVYTCPAGKLTIGIGRNLEDRGITEIEAEYLLNNDIVHCHNQLSSSLPFYDKLDDIRQEVLINMCFQMGLYGLLKFKNTLSFIEQGNYVNASAEMLNSKWALQTPNRAKELSKILERGEI